MSGVFDRLQQQIKSKADEGGITALDLIDLPPALRRIMRFMLRQVDSTVEQLRQAAAEFPAEDRLTDRQLDEALDALSEQQWLIRFGEDERKTYRVNLRRKARSTLQDDVWNALSGKLPAGPKNESDHGQDR